MGYTDKEKRNHERNFEKYKKISGSSVIHTNDHINLEKFESDHSNEAINARITFNRPPYYISTANKNK